MGRKSKQPGGHNPLTYHEQKRLKSSGYGTQSTRLTTESQLPFGHCCLSLSPALSDNKEGGVGSGGNGGVVATPSGHIYSREAIVQYLLTKNGDIKRMKEEYDKKRLDVESRRVEWEEKNTKKEENLFVKKDQGAMVVHGSNTNNHSIGDGSKKASAAAGTKNSKESGENSLKKISFWLASSQPVHQKGAGENGDFDYEAELDALPPPPPERPASPMSGNPLKLKQLIPLHLIREGDDDKSSKGKNSGNDMGKVLCAVSGKTITNHSVVAIRTSGQVMIRSVYEELARPTMTCPVTGKKFKEKDVIELQKAASGFAASGKVVAKKYNPTLT